MVYKLQYASNFFLNLHKFRDFKKMLVPSSENLALLGNVCSLDTNDTRKTYKQFLDYCSKNFKNVYIVPGVWEMCSKEPQDYNTCIHQLYSLKKLYKNVNVLNNSSVDVPNTDIHLIGSTLWTREPYIKHQCMYEYNFMWLKRHSGLGQVMGQDMVNWHLEDVDYLKDSFKNGGRFIVLTHHQPHPILINDMGRRPVESTNLQKLMRKPVEIWIGGAGDHTVSGCFGLVRDVFCSTNPYTTFSLAPQSTNLSYNPEATVSLRNETNQLV